MMGMGRSDIWNSRIRSIAPEQQHWRAKDTARADALLVDGRIGRQIGWLPMCIQASIEIDGRPFNPPFNPPLLRKGIISIER